MSFYTALSGLNAASTDLGITANNIANVNTTGFKRSRAEFGDVFAASTYGLSRNAIGAGVNVSNVAQQFSQGSINLTDNSLDLAISGAGFFTFSQNGALSYSRAGNLGVDRNGYVVNPLNARLQVFPPIPGGTTFNTGSLTDLQLSSADNPPSATTEVTVGTNLPANAAVPATAIFDPNDPTSYNHTSSLTTYDSLGVPHVTALYYVKTAAVNSWEVHSYVDGTAVGPATALTYSDAGALVTPVGGQVVLPPYVPTTGAAAMDITLDLTGTTQFGETFAVSELAQNGYAAGRLTGIEVSADGAVSARYTNGQTTALGQIAMTNFANPQGLQNLGNTAWGETTESGQPLRGQAGTAAFGIVQSGALEASNVDLTEQLVNMITAQRNFQANAQMISTEDQVTQTVINIRR